MSEFDLDDAREAMRLGAGFTGKSVGLTDVLGSEGELPKARGISPWIGYAVTSSARASKTVPAGQAMPTGDLPAAAAAAAAVLGANQTVAPEQLAFVVNAMVKTL